MARVQKISSVTGLTRLEALNKIREVEPNFDRKANFQRVERKFASLFSPSTVKPKSSKPARKSTTTPKSDKVYQVIDGKKTRISPLTGLTYTELRQQLKKDNPNYKNRSYDKLEKDFILKEYNKANPAKQLDNLDSLELKPVSKPLLRQYEGLRKFSEFVNTPENSPIINAVVDRVRVTYGAGDKDAFLKRTMNEAVRAIMGQNYAYDGNDIVIISRLIDGAEYGVKISDLKKLEPMYVQVIEQYFADKEEKRGNN